MRPRLVHRPGWPSNVVGPGKEAWTAFCQFATDEQVNRAVETLRRRYPEVCRSVGLDEDDKDD
jgi:hypothetical protein